ncbi:CHAT domain-containing protein [Alkalinema sp. FACHB-956]|uniref:CHAT domain-containing protein n=1 Tax=Alkalinema sp. FACHB-956 TaxID=2692768 RepID=UPI00168624C7|nr:CHAT domain-containing protein [Alkalinema sp. FACHB-956]MBD2329946.1 CHAT domain-containing protein [Alkalinema sp. FACHB-956]
MNLLLKRLMSSRLSLSVLSLPLGAIGLMASVQAQPIVPAADGTGTIVNQQGNRFEITGGSRSQDGSNLFHRFTQFGLETGQTANFLANPALKNILGSVNGGNPSIINGLIQITGGNPNLVLINPAGILFGSNASLNVPAAFTATTADRVGLGNQWLNVLGNNNYSNLLGTPNTFAFTAPQPSSIANFGNLAVPTGQNLSLLAGTVFNFGTLSAPGGQLTIASVSGQTVATLNSETGLLSLELQPWIDAPENFRTTSLPELLTGGNLPTATGVTVNADGTLQLTGSNLKIPTTTGTTIVSGTQDVSNPSSTSSVGGSITNLGTQVAIVNANLNASGNAGGGTIRIGGDYQGKGTIPNAEQTYIDQASKIQADALQSGDGGRVIVWSDRATQFNGEITAKGVTQGGFVEVSGKQNLGFLGKADVSASQGPAGTVLLDPQDINIIGFNPYLPPVNLDNGILFDQFGTTTDLSIQADEIAAITGNLILQASRDINLNQNITFTTPANSTVTFEALGNFNGTGFSIDTLGRNLIITANNISVGTITTSPGLFPNNLSAGSINFTARSGNISTGYLNIRKYGASVGDITLTANAGGITTGDLAIYGGPPTNNLLSQTGGNIGLTAGNGGIRTGVIISDVANPVGGAVTLSTTGAASIGSIYTRGLSRSGDVQISAGQMIQSGSVILDVTGDSGTGIVPIVPNAGDSASTIRLVSQQGNIDVKDVRSSNAKVGSNIDIIAQKGSLKTGVISASGTDRAGDINLWAAQNVTVGGAATQLDPVTQEPIVIGNRTVELGKNGKLVVNAGGTLTMPDEFLLSGSSLTIGDQLAPTTLVLPFILSTGGGNFSLSKAGDLTFPKTLVLTGGGDLTLKLTGTLTVPDSLVFDTAGGKLTLQAASIDAPKLVLSSAVLPPLQITSSPALPSSASSTQAGGNIEVIAQNQIRLKGIVSYSYLGNGGNVLVDPNGDVEIGFINAQGGTSGIGGNVDITTARFLRMGGSFTDRNGVLSTISTAGGSGGGSVIIRTNQLVPNVPFTIGDASISGTAAAITTGGTNRLNPTRSIAGTFVQGTAPSTITIITPDQPIITPLAPVNLRPFPEIQQKSPNENETPPASDNNLLDLGSQFDNWENDHTFEFSDYLDLPDLPRVISLGAARKTLERVSEVTGIRPALLYVGFVPTTEGAIERQEKDIKLRVKEQESLELLLVTPTEPPYVLRIPQADRTQVVALAQQFRSEVADPSKTNTRSYLKSAKKLYDWLIRPIERELRDRQIGNIAFVLDTGLRFIPLAALYDGKQFLVENYSIGLMPSLSLTDSRLVDLGQAEVLAAGATQFTDQAPLPAVQLELTNIRRLWPGSILLNQDFTLTNLKNQRQRQPFGLVHLSTHGEFLPGDLTDSYIQLQDQRLRLNQLRELNWNDPPLDLLVLSACRMALGDREAELGFAGLAVQAGARSALASLWNVNDEGTSGLMAEFYQQLRQSPIKAEAIRQAQIQMLKGQVKLQNGQLQWSGGKAALPNELESLGDRTLSHPYYWSAFTLIGSPW